MPIPIQHPTASYHVPVHDVLTPQKNKIYKLSFVIKSLHNYKLSGGEREWGYMSGGDDAPLNVDESDTMQLIRQAVLFENLELVTDLIRENPWSLTRTDRHGRTPLMLAAHNGRVDSLRALLALSDNHVNASNGAGKTALHLAAEAGEVSAVRQLLVAGADTGRRDAAGHCALESAHIAGHDNVAAAIIESIQLENDKLNEAHTNLMIACAEGDVEAVDRILADFPAKDHYAILNGRAPESDTALFIACTNGQYEVVKRLLEPNYDHVLVNQNTKDTVLHAAVSSQNVDVLQIMLEAFPALIANSNCDGCSCLHWAAESGSTEIVNLLEFEYPEQFIKEIDLLSCPPYRSAIDVNHGDNECRTALYRAASKGHTNVLQYMLAFRCLFTDGEMRCPFQLDVYCSRGRTPLMVAAYNQSLPVLTLLLDAGADVNLPLAILDSETCEEARCVGSGALVEATRSDAVHIVHFLHDRGALDTDNRALRLAAKNNNLKLIRVFLTRLVYPDPEYKVNKKNIDVGQSDWFIAAALQINTRLRTTRLSLAAITRVDLSCNRLTVFPSILFQMPSLRSLNLAENLITTIDMPGFYVTSTSLEILNLKQNRLESISPQARYQRLLLLLFSLVSVEQFQIDIFQFLSSLPQLTTLDISRNCLNQLPEFIWLCPSLKEINAASNHLASLPMVGSAARIGRIARGTQHPSTPTSPTKAESISISDAIDDPSNVFRKPLIRQNVWQSVINLSKVDDDSFFPDFPITSSSTLTTLNLSANRFQVFPFCLACTCPRLLSLNMSFNQLVSLPPIQCIPAHLRNLDLSGNLIRSAVRSQRSLSVSRHQPDIQLEEACQHKQHDTLEWLKTLNISNNQLESIPICAKNKVLFPNLSVLDASSNIIKVINADVSRLSSLSVLNLTGNKGIQTLPPELGMLSRQVLNLWVLGRLKCSLVLSFRLIHIRPSEWIISFVMLLFLSQEPFQSPSIVHTVCHAVTPSTDSTTMAVRRPRSPARQNRSRSKSAVRSQRSLSVSRHQPDIQLEEACQHKQHDTLEWLKTLNISNNQLESIPICAKNKVLFPNLSVLDASSNIIKVINADVSRLSSLSVLNLTGNKGIQTLPPELGMLWSLSLKGCQLKEPLDSMVNTDNCKTVEIVAHLKTILEETIQVETYITSTPNLGSDGVEKSLWEALPFLKHVQKEVPPRGLLLQGESVRIAEWKFEAKKQKGEAALGPIGYSAWDFTGQREYHATHHYFLTRRTLYVVVWRVIDGDLALHDVQRWLINIQASARAPNSCVVLVGTHVDQISSNPTKFPHGFLEEMESKVRSRFMIVDADKHGLPRVLDLVLVNGKAKSDIKNLLNVIYNSGWEVRIGKERALDQQIPSAYIAMLKNLLNVIYNSGWEVRIGKERALDQQIPSAYIAMLKVVRELHADLRRDVTSAIMTAEQFRDRTKQRMVSKFGRTFRDDIEFRGVCAFLHDSGEIVHFEDAALRQLIFVDPVWLADYLAAIVALRSPHRSAGLLSQDALTPLIKQFRCADFGAPLRGSLLDLLQKCELALPCLARLLVVPALLPDEYRLRADFHTACVKLMIKGHSVFLLKQFYAQAEVRDLDYTLLNFRTRDEQKRWRTFPLDQYALVEMLFPALSVTVIDKDHKMTISTEGEGSTRLLALVVDLLDTLLEDWYPAIGTRFVHSSEGDLLVNRFVPCSKCASEITTEVQRARDDADLSSRKSSDHKSVFETCSALECEVRKLPVISQLSTSYIALQSRSACLQ
ncbi:leucine Rich repeat-containing domain protein, partial [Ostertagia ostertagi]